MTTKLKPPPGYIIFGESQVMVRAEGIHSVNIYRDWKFWLRRRWNVEILYTNDPEGADTIGYVCYDLDEALEVFEEIAAGLRAQLLRKDKSE